MCVFQKHFLLFIVAWYTDIDVSRILCCSDRIASDMQKLGSAPRVKLKKLVLLLNRNGLVYISPIIGQAGMNNDHISL